MLCLTEGTQVFAGRVGRKEPGRGGLDWPC